MLDPSAKSLARPLSEVIGFAEQLCDHVLANSSDEHAKDLALRVWFELKCMATVQDAGRCGLPPLRWCYDWRRDSYWS